MNEDGLPVAHPNFLKHFTADIYEDVANDLAPFGSDEGYDMIFSAAECRREVSAQTTVEELLDVADAPLNIDWDEAFDEDDASFDAALVVSAAFALIRLTGRIDKPGLDKALLALDVLIEDFGEEPELLQQKADLESWES
ncbi:hypothetical protein AUR04nite_29350 [Glutamicibacter uratoxydans]|uniref:DUF4259 domain-containing protein n=2 Tax=Glutamicibacter uratoxydans TaxID=43667 RepID=A0A4Y4DRY3_GLUUR|nr:hypothetical protein AUR04nite_29350 [Glutamicibacter uratoxydans]